MTSKRSKLRYPKDLQTDQVDYVIFRSFEYRTNKQSLVLLWVLPTPQLRCRHHSVYAYLYSWYESG